MDVSYILNELNEAQRQAVAAPKGNLLVLAGAGSGKTRVLVHRIAWLIQAENMSPHSVLAVTFTNKAAKEMRARIDELLGLSAGGFGAPRSMWVGTFHGIAHRLLKAHHADALLPSNFQILDSDDQFRLIKRIHKQLALDEGQWPARQSQWFINGQKDEGRRAAHIENYGNDLHLNTMSKIYLAYEQACERQGVVDFAELLLRAHELWLKSPKILQYYQQRFETILVDEFQDTNTIQYAWLRVLAGKQMPVIAVGDDDQSIYGWRGAKIENIQQYAKDFPNTQIVRLEQNYRSTASILKAANAVIENNTDRLGKELWTQDEDGELISLYAGFNEQDEARFVVERIEEWVKDGNLRASAAILYRSNAQSRVLEEALIRSGMPYRIYGGQRFYDRMEIKNALAYMRLINNRNDDTAMERVFNMPTRGIGSKTVDTVRRFAREQGISLWQAAGSIVNKKLIPNRAATAVQLFIDLINGMNKATDDLPLDELSDHIIVASGLIDFHKKEKGEKGQARIENLQELVVAAKQFVPEDENITILQAFLDEAALDAGEQQADEFEDSVQLMTLHSAKGLEFPIVFMVGVEENLFPHKMSLEESGRLEEERRLCYVGITRAMQKLYITYAETRRMYGTENFNKPSRFIREIPKELMQEVRLNTTITRPVSYEPAFRNHEIPNTGVSLGQQVFHSIFGVGTVINYEGQGPAARVEVNFDDEGNKWLVMQYANLQPL
jgi:DNA helicase-2/ATP-dependent DNA helicase PcrA